MKLIDFDAMTEVSPSSKRDRLITIAALQFVIYTIFSVLGFVGWVMSIIGFIGEGYVSGHLTRWTEKFPIWGLIILATGVLSSAAAVLLWRSSRLGGYLGILSFALGFTTNIVVARNLIVHVGAGALIGWIMLVPLIAGWKSLRLNMKTSEVHDNKFHH